MVRLICFAIDGLFLCMVINAWIRLIVIKTRWVLRWAKSVYIFALLKASLLCMTHFFSLTNWILFVTEREGTESVAICPWHQISAFNDHFLFLGHNFLPLRQFGLFILAPWLPDFWAIECLLVTRHSQIEHDAKGQVCLLSKIGRFQAHTSIESPWFIWKVLLT